VSVRDYFLEMLQSIMKTYNKLVRDRIPEIIEENGDECVTHIADGEEFKEKLHEKLVEEVEEFLCQPSEEELADILEVIDALVDLHEFDREVVEKKRVQKRDARGGFKSVLF
jgi:predicted house-cleaning noncanonical NTP pyrophosphatase (MazG superfamily)